MDDVTMANDNVMTRAEFVEYMEAFENRIKVRFEETNSLIRLSVEAVDALRKTTVRGFADMRGEHQQQIDLIHVAVTCARAPGPLTLALTCSAAKRRLFGENPRRFGGLPGQT